MITERREISYYEKKFYEIRISMHTYIILTRGEKKHKVMKLKYM